MSKFVFGLLFLTGFAWSQFGSGEPAELSAPICYDDLMLILSDEKGVAAVVFTKEIEQGVHYKYRFLSKEKKTEISGEKLVVSKFRKEPTDLAGKYKLIDEGSEFWIRPGPIAIEWSYCMPGRGWVYYTPEKLTLLVCHSKDFAKIDLNRFLKK